MPARVNCRLIWPFLATGTENLFAGASRLKTVVPVKTLCNSLIGNSPKLLIAISVQQFWHKKI